MATVDLINVDLPKLRRLIAAHVSAQIDLANKGSQMPEDFPRIEYDAKQARAKLNDYVRVRIRPTQEKT